MPRGGGGHGGGGHSGGGGHHFGGRRHHYGGGARHRSRYYGSSDCEECNRSPYSWGCFLFSVSIVLLVVPVTVTYQRNSTITSATFSPADTRIVSVSSELCQGAKLNSLSSLTTGVTASLYLLQKKPILTKDNFTFVYTENLRIAYEYRYVSFHLYPGTMYSLSACLGPDSGSTSVTYLVIKGTSDFNEWVDAGSSSLAYSNSVLYLSVGTSLCGITNTSATLTFFSEDDYYFIIDNVHTTLVDVTFTVAFNRFEYLPSSGVIVDSCSTTLSATSCSLSFPYSSGYTVLVETSSSPNGDTGANVDISLTCEARAWVYAVIEVSMGIVVVLCAISICLGLYFVLMKNKKEAVVPSAQPDPQIPTTQPYSQYPPQVSPSPQDPAEKLAAETASFPQTAPLTAAPNQPAYYIAGSPPTYYDADSISYKRVLPSENIDLPPPY